MRIQKCGLAVAMTAGLLCAAASAAVSQPLYWLEQGSTNAIKRAAIDGTNAQTVVSGVGFINSFAVDPVGGHIYWITADSIGMSALDGSQASMLISGIGVLGSTFPAGHPGLAVDGLHHEIYFTTDATIFGTGYIGRLNRVDFSGQNLTTIISTSPTSDESPNEVALDPIAGRLYWTQTGSVSTLAKFGARSVARSR